MADKTQALILAALERAAAEPSGLPLLGTKSAPGLFAGGAAAKQAAQQCKDQGFLRVLGSTTKGKNVQEIFSLSDKGLAYLLEQANPRDVLQAFVGALEARQTQVGDLLNTARATHANLDALKVTAERVLQQFAQKRQNPPPVPVEKSFANGAGTCLSAVLNRLKQWQASGTLDDCPLPDLYRTARQAAPALTIGHFHDGLRRLYDTAQIYLHPWTGPLYEVPEPALALLVGHEIAYYASLREVRCQESGIRNQESGYSWPILDS